MKDVDLIALAGLLHDIGKFGQRADAYKLRDGAYKHYDYKYTHASYTAQILNDLVFNLGEDMSDASAMHHNPQNDTHWIIAAADRMASGFERENFEEYNELHDKEDFKKQRLWYLFDEKKRYKIDTLSPENIFPHNDNAITNEYDALWEKFVNDMEEIKDKGNSSIDSFTIDYLLKKYTSFIPSSTSFKSGNYNAVKANIPLYEHSKATAIFASVIYKLQEQNNNNILNYYRHQENDIHQNDMLLIAGDFFGIQKFIFNSVASSKASKILRAKSAYIQILTKVIAFYIVDELGLSYQSIISTNAGKFEILGINDDDSKEKLKKIQKELDSFFIEKYFGETGVGVSFTPCCLSDFIKDGEYKNNLRKRVDKAVEKSKFQKFNLSEIDTILKIDDEIDNQNLCPLCSKRKIVDEYCKDCNDFVKIGQNLPKKTYLSISKNSGQIHIFGNYYINFSDKVQRIDNTVAIFDISNDEEFKGYAKWELASYVSKLDSLSEDELNYLKSKDKNDAGLSEILTFENLAYLSVKEGIKENQRKEGVEAIMALKGDVDFMGNYIKNPKNEVTNSFARFNFFARMVDYFFSVKASSMMKGKNLYTVFAGGDDIFILGAWDEVIEYALDLQQEFEKFATGSGLTFSVGMIMTKPNKPINFVAEISEKALEESKDYKKEQVSKDKEKNAITLFGQTVSWIDYTKMLNDFKIIQDMATKYPEEFGTTFWYRLLEFSDMRENLQTDDVDIKNALWRSKVAYMFKRNIIDKHKDENFDDVIEKIEKNIETYGAAFKMVVSEEIYKRRD